MSKAQTDKEKAEAENQKLVAETKTTTAEDEQKDYGLPEGVTTSQTRGENDVPADAALRGEAEGLPNPTVEEQLEGGSDEQKEAVGIEPEHES